MKVIIRKLLREGLNKNTMLFLRWTDSPENDIERNFSGHMQAWYDTYDEAMADYEKRKSEGAYLESEPKEDPVSGMWNSDPEWGLSGYGFNNEETFNKALDEITDIAWHHKDNNSQDLYLFRSSNYILGNGFDGEDTFRDADRFWYINDSISFDDIQQIISK
jgi:hypothetical protein